MSLICDDHCEEITLGLSNCILIGLQIDYIRVGSSQIAWARPMGEDENFLVIKLQGQ